MILHLIRRLRPIYVLVGLVLILAFLVGIQVQSAQSATACIPGPDQVALFTGINYGGDCMIKELGRYPVASSIGLPDDSISSLKVGVNVHAVLYGDANYAGRKEIFISDEPNLQDHWIGDDQVTALRVSDLILCVPNLETHPPPCDY
jgi:hypothetical protein